MIRPAKTPPPGEFYDEDGNLIEIATEPEPKTGLLIFLRMLSLIMIFLLIYTVFKIVKERAKRMIRPVR